MSKHLAALLNAFLLLAAPLAAAAAQPVPVAGVDYIEIEGGTPYQPLRGKIEVAEVFAYWCHHCADFQPRVDAWKRKLPANVRFTYVPLASAPDDALARAYFAAEATGVLGRTHNATFRAIHGSSTLPKNATSAELVEFYRGLGVDPGKFRAALEGAGTGEKLKQARAFALRSGVEGTPTLVINGRYRVRGRTLDDNLRIASYLIALQRSGKP
jgi:thiol:disulfide interchange protein DsbA